MLKKMKGKMKRRNTEPFMGQAGSSAAPAQLSIPAVAETLETLNNEF
jgi:hypothetical protein